MTKSEVEIILNNHINNLENLEEELSDLQNSEELYLNLLNLLNQNSYNEIYDNIDIISLTISSLLDDSVASKIIDKLFNIVYRLKEIENICGETAIEEREYRINEKIFDSLKNYFEQGHKKLIQRKKEIKKIYSKDRLAFIRGIVLGLHYSQKIYGYEINQLPYILSEANISIEDQIRILEIIRKHNQLLVSKINNGKLIEKLILK